MWCPSVSLSVWANAWLAGAAAPDDVLDALSQWAPRHSVTAYDSVAAGRTGLPWPDLNDAGAVSLLQTLRTAAGPRLRRPPIGVALPVPGDVRGLPAGTQFQRDAVTAGEAIIVGARRVDRGRPGPRVRVRRTRRTRPSSNPEPIALSWTVYSVPTAAPTEYLDLGEAEYALRSAVRSAADALGAIRAERAADVADPRGLVEQVLESRRAAPGARPRTVAGGARAGERRPHRRDHHRQLGADADRAADVVGGADRQRRAAPAVRGGAIGADGRGQRDPALGLARA